MSKSILITESQKKTLLYESANREFNDIIKRNYEFTKEIITQASEQMGLNLQFLITWGASIGGFVGPLNELIQGKFPTLSEQEVTLILTGIIATYYIDNKKLVAKILNEIKSAGVIGEFTSLLRKSSQLKDTFVDFINSLNITLHKVTNIMSYAFLIPLIPIIYNSVTNEIITSSDAKEIALRVSAFGLLTVSGIIVKELFSKLIKRFSSPR